MEVGVVLAGKYRLEALLGHGGMGSVWRAHHLGLEAPVAVKLMAPGIMTAPGMLQRFHREAQAAARLRSPHVVQIFDHGVDSATSTPFIVMELLEGESLLERLGRVRTLSPLKTARLVTDVCRALSRAHEAGIIHRDLKPANLFLVPNDDQEVTKVLDFGIAKSPLPFQGVESTTNSGSILGTPLYMSPEQISGGKQVDARSDLWSLAVVVCECLTGRRPFSADSIGALTLIICTEPPPVPSRLGPVPENFDAWFERAVSRDPSARFQTAREFAEEFRKVCGLSSSEEAEFLARNSGPPDAPQDRGEDGRASTTARQWGRPVSESSSDSGDVESLPLAPTVDLKEGRTAGALSKTSHELTPAGSHKRLTRRLVAAGAILAVIGVGLLLLRRGSEAPPLRVSPNSALPVNATHTSESHASSPGTPVVTPKGAPALEPVPASAGSTTSPRPAASGVLRPRVDPAGEAARTRAPAPSAAPAAPSAAPAAPATSMASAPPVPEPAPPPKPPTLEDVIIERR
jgi:serine/threonine-protein kinase